MDGHTEELEQLVKEANYAFHCVKAEAGRRHPRKEWVQIYQEAHSYLLQEYKLRVSKMLVEDQ